MESLSTGVDDEGNSTNIWKSPTDPGVAGDGNSTSVWAWSMCGMLLLATMLNYMDRQALAVNSPVLKEVLKLDEEQYGRIEASFGYAFAFGSLFFGFLADRIGPRYLYPVVLSGWSLAGVATGLAGKTWVTDAWQLPDEPGSGVFVWLLGCRVVLGAFEAGHWPCAFLTLRSILSSKDRALGSGILQSGASIGAILVPIYVSIVKHYGLSWEFTFWSIGIVGLIWVPIWFLMTWGRDLSLVPSTRPVESSAHESDGNLIWRLLTLACIIVTLNIGWQFLRAWMPLFLVDYHKYSQDAMSLIVSGYFISSDVGCILSGALVTFLATYGWAVDPARKLGFFLFVLLAGCATLVPFAGSGPFLVVLLYLAGAGVLGLHPYYYAMVQELPKHHIGLLSGVLTAFGWIVLSVFQANVGTYVKRNASYDLAFYIVGLIPVIGLIALLTIWPKPLPSDAESSR